MPRQKKKQRERAPTRAELALDAVIAGIGQVLRRTDVVIERVEQVLAVRPERPPFVCAVLEGHGQRGPISLAVAGEVTNGQRTFELRTDSPVYVGRLIVFCDLERVSARVYRGADLLQGSLDGCPVVYVPTLEPGYILRIQCEVRS